MVNSGADLCFVALGAPKQELFADHGKRLLPNVSFVCIGAGLDFIAGTQVRAPHWMQRWNLEWLWRAASNPRRLLYRYLLCMVLYLAFSPVQLSCRGGVELRPERSKHRQWFVVREDVSRLLVAFSVQS